MFSQIMKSLSIHHPLMMSSFGLKFALQGISTLYLYPYLPDVTYAEYFLMNSLDGPDTITAQREFVHVMMTTTTTTTTGWLTHFWLSNRQRGGMGLILCHVPFHRSLLKNQKAWKTSYLQIKRGNLLSCRFACYFSGSARVHASSDCCLFIVSWKQFHPEEHNFQSPLAITIYEPTRKDDESLCSVLLGCLCGHSYLGLCTCLITAAIHSCDNKILSHWFSPFHVRRWCKLSCSRISPHI